MIITKKSIICDQCKKKYHKPQSNWIQIRTCPSVPISYNGTGISLIPCGEFCSVGCLQRYLELWPEFLKTKSKVFSINMESDL